MEKNNNKNSRLIQLRFSHYLRSFRTEKNISQNELAKLLNVAESLIPKLENTFPYPRIINCLQYLKSFADLQSISSASFVSILENGDSTSKESEWGQIFLSFF